MNISITIPKAAKPTQDKQAAYIWVNNTTIYSWTVLCSKSQTRSTAGESVCPNGLGSKNSFCYTLESCVDRYRFNDSLMAYHQTLPLIGPCSFLWDTCIASTFSAIRHHLQAIANLRPNGRLSTLFRIYRLWSHWIRHLRKRTQEETKNASHTGSYRSNPTGRANPIYRLW